MNRQLVKFSRMFMYNAISLVLFVGLIILINQLVDSWNFYLPENTIINRDADQP